MRYPCAQHATAGPGVLFEMHSSPFSSCIALPSAMSHTGRMPAGSQADLVSHSS